MKNLDGKDLVTIIPLRQGSKGLPGKNIMELSSKPLYMHAVEQGLKFSDRVILSTNIKQIRDAKLPDRCSICWRPSSLAGDKTPMKEVISHTIKKESLENACIILLQSTSPLRSEQDIRKCKELFNSGEYDLVMSVVKKDNKVLKYGLLERNTFTPLSDPDFCFYNRQDLPPSYGPNGAIYIMDARKFMIEENFPSKKIGAVKMPLSRSHDIDSLKDFLMVEKLFTEHH